MTFNSSPGKLFCFGLGYTGSALARYLSACGWQVDGSIRSPENNSPWTRSEATAHIFNGEEPCREASESIRSADYVLSCIRPTEKGDPVLNHHAQDLIDNRNLKWAGYLSTTGVYGDHAEAEVDESSPLNPGNERNRRRATAEREWLKLWEEHSLPVHIFRLVGIYGPGRGTLEKLKQGTAQRIDCPGAKFSHIHVDDAVQVIARSMQSPNPGAIYNVCDDAPVSQRESVEHACDILNIPYPPLVRLEDSGLSELGRSFYSDRKRVQNRRIKEELGVKLKFPNYREGLAALTGQRNK